MKIDTGTAQEDRRLHATGYRQIAARTGRHATQMQHTASGQRQRSPTRQRHPFDTDIDRSASDRNDRGALKLQHRPAQRDLESGRGNVIANQGIGERACWSIHGAAATDAEPRQTLPPSILHRGQQTRLQHLHIHRRMSGHVANSAASMRRKRTRSPGASRHGDSADASNKRCGVRPIRCQPPGKARG